MKDKMELLSIVPEAGGRICMNIRKGFDDYHVLADIHNGFLTLEAAHPKDVLGFAQRCLREKGYPYRREPVKTSPQAPESLETHNKHYAVDENGDDLIDRWSKRYSIEEVRVLMWAMMEKYNDRLGKKDEPKKEVQKIATFAARWAKIEAEK